MFPRGRRRQDTAYRVRAEGGDCTMRIRLVDATPALQANAQVTAHIGILEPTGLTSFGRR